MDEHPTGVPDQPRPRTEAAEPSPPAERIDATALVLTCVSLLAAKAWEAMGLVPDPVTKKIERHLEDAQVAIDAAAALVEIVRGRVSDAERRDLETLLTNLRLNFVEQRAKS